MKRALVVTVGSKQESLGALNADCVPALFLDRRTLEAAGPERFLLPAAEPTQTDRDGVQVAVWV